MTVELLQERLGVRPYPKARPPDIVHIVCECSLDDHDIVLAFCGWNVTFDEPRREGDRVQCCRVCDELAADGCRMCGFDVRAPQTHEAARPE